MKTKITIALLVFISINSYAQWLDKKTTEYPLIIHSSQGRIEIKNPSACKQLITESGAISVNCETQCKQAVNKQGKVVIQC